MSDKQKKPAEFSSLSRQHIAVINLDPGLAFP